MLPAAVLLNKHVCPMVTPGMPPTPHAGGGMIMLGSTTVMIGKYPAARMGDSLLCNGPPPHSDAIMKGSTSVLIDKKPAARMGDVTAMGGVIIQGCTSVMIGG